METIYIMAARYAHHRNTGAALAVVSQILKDWDKLSQQARDQLQREAHEASCNFEDWKMLIER